MPQDVAVPTWYIDNQYISEKVDECNTIKFGAVEGQEFTPWTPETVRTFIAGVNDSADYAPWMGYDNFVSNGNAENCSPNPLFDVMQYVYAKAAQLNAMNDGAGFGANGNQWTGLQVLDYFKANNITAWDHFTTAGQFEGVNPSNAMDLSDFLTRKAAQCNAEEFDGKSDWTPESVLEYYRDNSLNAVEVAVSANDPNVVAVPAEEAVTVPTNLNPWGTDGALNVVNLTSDEHVYNDNGIPTNFVGVVDSSASKSTFNNVDQITGTDDSDVLTVAMNADFRGMDKGGFVKGIPTVDLNNTAGKDVTFDATGVDGVTTWNADGNINFVDLAAPGINVNLENVNTTKGINVGFVADSVTGTNDSLALGLNNVFVPGRVNSQTGTDQPNTAVAVKSAGIENVDINSTGINENMVNLNNVNFMQALTVKGDADLEAEAFGTQLTTIDATKATGDLTVWHDGKALTNVAAGAGDDVINTGNIAASATVDGGAGADRLNIQNANGQYNLNMTNVETLQVSSNITPVTIQGDNVEGMENLKLSNDQNDVILGHFTQSQLNVQAINENTGNLVIADIGSINMRVGDGSKYTEDSFTAPGSVKLGSATDLTINADDGIDADSPQSTFNAPVYAENLQSLTMQAAKGSHVLIAGDSDLQALSNVTVQGYGEFVLGSKEAQVGVDSSLITVDTNAMNGNSTFKGIFLNNTTTGGATLNVTGGTLGDNFIVADNTFARVTMNAGMGDDTLILNAGSAKVWTQGAISGDLGTQTGDTLVIDGKPYVENPDGSITYSDFSALKGVDTVKVTDPAIIGQFVAAGSGEPGIVLPVGIMPTDVVYDPYWHINDVPETTTSDPGTVYEDNFVLNIDPDQVGTIKMGGMGNTDTYTGTINSDMVNVEITALNPALPGHANRGAFTVNFGDASDQLNIVDVNNLTLDGTNSTSQNTVTGTADNIKGDFTLTTGTGKDLINMQMVDAGGNVTINGRNNSNLVIAQANAQGTELAATQKNAQGDQIGGINAGGTAQVTATNNVANILLGDIAAGVVNLGTSTSALANSGDILVGDITADGVAGGNTSIPPAVNIYAANTGLLSVGDIAAANTTAIGQVTINASNNLQGNVTIGNITQSGGTGIDVANIGDFSIGTISAGRAAAGSQAAITGNVDIDANNTGTATIGAISSNDGPVIIDDTSDVTTLEVGAINAGTGAVTIRPDNTGATTLDGITTTGTATIIVDPGAGATTLKAGIIDELHYTGNAKVDTIGSSTSRVQVGADTDIDTAAGNDSIFITATGNGTVAIDSGTSTGTGDVVNAVVTNSQTTDATLLDITAGSGKDTITLASNDVKGTSVITVNGFNAATDGDVIDASGIGNWIVWNTDVPSFNQSTAISFLNTMLPVSDQLSTETLSGFATGSKWAVFTDASSVKTAYAVSDADTAAPTESVVLKIVGVPDNITGSTVDINGVTL